MKALHLLLSFAFLVKAESGYKLSLENVPCKNVMTVHGLLEPEVFFKSHAVKNVPVVMRSAGNEFAGDLDISRLDEIPESYTTYLEMMRRGDVTSGHYQFLKIYGDENLFVNTPFPTVMKSKLQFPKSLLCKSVARGMKRTRLTFTSGEWRRDFESDTLHGLLCQLGGHSNLHLVGPSALTPEGGVSKYFTAKLDEGDCIFTPSGWAHQQNSTGKYLSINIYWAADSESDGSECDAQPINNMMTSHFPDDPPEDLLSIIQFNDLHHFIKEYYLNPSLMDLTHFMNTVIQDKYFADVLVWNEECKDIAEEMFFQLDYNADGFLSKEDIQSISKEDLQELAGKLDDRLADFSDIIDDSKVEKKGSLFNEARKATNSANEIRKLIEDSFSDIFKDIDTAKKTGFAKTLEPDREENELKRIEKLLKDSISQQSIPNKEEL